MHHLCLFLHCSYLDLMNSEFYFCSGIATCNRGRFRLIHASFFHFPLLFNATVFLSFSSCHFLLLPFPSVLSISSFISSLSYMLLLLIFSTFSWNDEMDLEWRNGNLFFSWYNFLFQSSPFSFQSSLFRVFGFLTDAFSFYRELGFSQFF